MEILPSSTQPMVHFIHNSWNRKQQNHCTTLRQSTLCSQVNIGKFWYRTGMCETKQGMKMDMLCVLAMSSRLLVCITEQLGAGVRLKSSNARATSSKVKTMLHDIHTFIQCVCVCVCVYISHMTHNQVFTCSSGITLRLSRRAAVGLSGAFAP